VTALRPVFTLDDATASGLRKDQVYAMVADGQIERIGRGVYARPDVIDPAFVSLSAATLVRADATLCLTSALAFHDLTDQIPAGADIRHEDEVAYLALDAQAVPLGDHDVIEIAGIKMEFYLKA